MLAAGEEFDWVSQSEHLFFSSSYSRTQTADLLRLAHIAFCSFEQDPGGQIKMRRGCELSQGGEILRWSTPKDNAIWHGKCICVRTPAHLSVCIFFQTDTLREIIAWLIFLSKQFCNFSPAREQKKLAVGVEKREKRQRLPLYICICFAGSHYFK